MRKDELKGRWHTDDSARTNVLERARRCAVLTKPWILPPESHNADQKLPENYQSEGSYGITNLEGLMLLALFPPGVPWFRFSPAANIRHDPRVPIEFIQTLEQTLFLHELLIMSILESAHLSNGTANGTRRRNSFRTRKRMALSQFLATGDTLEQLTDDYRIKVFRRDQYVTKRDSSGDVLYHGVREEIDPLTLADEQLGKCGLSAPDLEAKSVSERMEPIFTFTEWQPRAKTWVVKQEVRGHIINTSEEPVSQFFSTPFELVAGENYGRGFVEQNLGDFTTLDELSQRIIDFAAMASKMTPVIDHGSEVREEDLTKPTGVPIRARVHLGVVQDIGWMKLDKVTDFQIIFQTVERLSKRLGRAMLIESETTPRGDRVTRYQVQRVAKELEGALGGFYAPVADEQQVPLMQRVVYQAKRDRLLPPLPDEAIEVRAITGIDALSREANATKLMSLAEFVNLMGDPARRKIDQGVAVDLYARAISFSEPGLIKSNEQLAAEDQEAMQLAAQATATEKAIDVGGNVAEAALTQPQGQ